MISKLFKWAAAITCALPLVAGAETVGDWFSGGVENDAAIATSASWQTNGVDVLSSTLEVEGGKIVVDNDGTDTLDLVPTVDAPDTNVLTRVIINSTFPPNDYDSLDDLASNVSDAKTALTLAIDAGGNTNYYAHTGSTWVKLFGANPPASDEEVVTAIVELNAYETSVTASFKIGDNWLTDENNTTNIVLSTTQANVTKVSFAGSCLLESVDTDMQLGVAKVDNIKYPTYAKAFDASTKSEPALPVYILRTNTSEGSFASLYPGYGLVENDGFYTVVDNTASTWTGSTDNDWAKGSNWSTGCAPTDYTDVTIPSENVPEGGWLIYVGGNAKSKSIALLGNATIQRDAGITHNGCLNVQEGITTGATPSTLTLNSSFIFAGDSEVSIACPIVCANGNSSKTSGFTSNSTGTFNISGEISGTGTLEFRKAVTLSQDLTVASDGLSAKFEAQPTFSNGAVLKGDGTVVWTVEPAQAVQNMLKDANNWTGVCELGSIAINSIDAANYGNANSTVRFNGVSGFLRYSSGSTTEVGKVMCIDIGANGLTLNNGFSSGTFGYIIAAKITGSGPMHFGTRHNDASVGQYFLTGDMSEFTGAIDFGSLTGYRPAVIIKTALEDAPAVDDYGQIIVAAGRTGEQAPRIASTWDAPGGLVIYGEAKLANGGSITSVNGVAGSGKLVYENFPTAAPTWCEGLTSSGTGRDVPAWTGAVELPSRNGSGSIALAPFGLSGSKIILNGITGQDANSIYLADATAIPATVELKGLLKLTNGSSGNNYTFAEVTGDGNMFLSATGSGGSPYYTYTFTKLTDYTGEINAVKTSESKYAALQIGTVAVSTWTLGQKMVDLADNCNLTTSPGSINVEVNGGSSLDGHHLFKAADGDLYVLAAQVTVDETTTYFATLEEAAEFALANDAQIAKVDPATPTALPGWSYDKGYFTKLDIAQVGETTYKTLAAAIATGTTDDIVLVNDCAETVTLGVGQTIKPGAYAFSGVLKGEGTIYYAAKPTTVPTFEDWTGTFVADWDGAHGTPFPANDYGILGSVIEVRKLGGGYVPLPGSENVDRTVLPTISIPEGCFMKLANGYYGFKTVFTKVTGAGAMTNNSYLVEIATLENFTGSISSDFGTKIVDVVTAAAAAPGDCLVKGGSFTDVESMTVNGAAPAYALEYKGDVEQPGIYYHVAATLFDGESVSNYGTVVEALSYAYIRLPNSFGWVVTVLDNEWVDEGTYDEFFTWDPVARTYTVKTYPVRIAATYYPTLAAAVAAAKDGDKIVLVDDVTLDARVEPNLGSGTALTFDLGGKTITRTGTSGNGSVIDVKSGNVVITNGVIDCTQDDAAIVSDGVYAITARSGANVTLGGLTVTVDSQAGACVYPFDGAQVTILSGTYANTTQDAYQYKTGWTGMAVNQANVSTQLITIYGGSFKQVDPTLGDDSWASAGNGFLASGYAATWNPSTGYYDVAEYVPPSDIDPTSGTEIAVDTTKTPEEQAAEAQTKADAMDVKKTADAASVDQTTWNSYFTKTAEKVNDVWVAKAELNPAVVLPVDGAEETPLTDMLESVTAAAVDTTGETTASVPTKAGLYYWIAGATEVNAASYTPGMAVLGNGETKPLARPTLTGENGKAFFKVCVDIVAPTQD